MMSGRCDPVNTVNSSAVDRGGDRTYLPVRSAVRVDPCFHVRVQRGLFWPGLKLVCVCSEAKAGDASNSLLAGSLAREYCTSTVRQFARDPARARAP